jgi:broad specificity phosphatase PhoE
VSAAPTPDQPRPLLYLVRHGETEWSRDGLHTSHTDLPLTPTGEKAADALAPRLAGVAFDLVLTSPLRRARDTARRCGFPDADVEPDAREWDYGEYEGRTTAEIRETVPGWRIWSDGAPGGETPEQVGERADRIIRRIKASTAGPTTRPTSAPASAPTIGPTSGPTNRQCLIFAHGHFLRVLTARWLGLPPQDGALYRLDTSTLSVLGWEREVAVMLKWNA